MREGSDMQSPKTSIEIVETVVLAIVVAPLAAVALVFVASFLAFVVRTVHSLFH